MVCEHAYGLVAVVQIERLGGVEINDALEVFVPVGHYSVIARLLATVITVMAARLIIVLELSKRGSGGGWL